MNVALLIVLCIGTLVTSADVAAAQSPTFTEQEARVIAEQAATASKGDRKVFDRTFRELAKKRAPDYLDGGYTLHGYGLVVLAYSRLAFFQNAAWEQVRTLKPVADAQWPKHEVIVTLTSTQMTDPLIDRIVLKRNDLIVAPTESVIVEGEAKNLTGAVFKAREGWVGFPLNVFMREKNVKLWIVLIPVSAAKNIEARVDNFALTRIHMSRK